MAQNRPIFEIAAEIRKFWRKKDGTPNVNYAAKPYLEAMETLDSINDMYIADSAREIVLRFLCNATAWRGDDARRIKAELKAMIGSH